MWPARPTVGSQVSAAQGAGDVSALSELVAAAGNASCILGHAYHTQLKGGLSREAHDAYQRLDNALTAFNDESMALAELVAAARLLIESESRNQCFQNRKQSEAHNAIRTALARLGGAA